MEAQRVYVPSQGHTIRNGVKGDTTLMCLGVSTLKGSP